MSKIITMIPVRMASTRLPNKPLLDINGKTLIQRVYENVKACVPGDIVIAAGGTAGSNGSAGSAGKAGSTVTIP